jgi:hypothetical protein
LKPSFSATRQTELINPDKPKRVGGMTPEQMARLERENTMASRDLSLDRSAAAAV